MTYADIPLIRPATLEALRAGLASGADLVALGFAPADPTGYGGLIEREGAWSQSGDTRTLAKRSERRGSATPVRWRSEARRS